MVVWPQDLEVSLGHKARLHLLNKIKGRLPSSVPNSGGEEVCVTEGFKIKDWVLTATSQAGHLLPIHQLKRQTYSM